MDQLGLEETSWCLDLGGHMDIYPPYTQSLTYIHIYTMNPCSLPTSLTFTALMDGGEESKSEEFLIVICVHSFIQPIVIKNRLVMSGTALVLETNRQTRRGVCLWGALHVAGGADKKVGDHNTTR